MPFTHAAHPHPPARSAVKIPHLGDFHVPPRVAVITALAVPVGAAAALVAVGLLKLIALFTNLCFHGRFAFVHDRTGTARRTGGCSCSCPSSAAWSSA